MSVEWIPERPTESYWSASADFRALCKRKLTADAWAWAEPQLEAMGEQAAREVAYLAQIADRETPRLVTHDARGERISRVEYHPAYREMERIAYGSNMIGMKYQTHEHSSSATFVGFAIGYLFAMAECGLYCPACMTDGVARVLTRHGTHEQVMRVVPHLTSSDPRTLWTGGMFLTERAGGSDVGANETVAKKDANGVWRLTGHKWFCSNVDAEAVLVTARVNGEGTRGLRTFLLETRDNPGFIIERLKDKLGVRSMATGEVTLREARAEEVGSFGAMTDMLNLSRLYNSVAAVAVIGRAVYEARHYIERRQAFGRPVIEFPLAQETFFDIEAEHIGALLLTFETVEMLGRADAGDEEAARLLRILTPIAKAMTGKLAVPCVSEAMELLGGNGYIEESPMPRLLRDAQVLPIWEGTTNILVLDAVRVMHKDGAHELLLSRIRSHKEFARDADSLAYRFASLDEHDARGWIDKLARLYEMTLLIEAGHGEYADRLRDRPLGMIPGARC
jgi:acyl-CoA dehydrogenase